MHIVHLFKDGLRHIHPDPEQARTITVREAARLQTFPDDYYFNCSQTDAFKMIGNAVPPLFAKKVAYAIYHLIQENQKGKTMKYYLKRLGHQELGSVKNGKAQRGRYIYISKDKNVLDIFPPLSKTVTNDSSIIPIIPLYQKVAKKIYCNYIYHNDKYNVSGGTRNEYRIYCNGALEGKQLLFQPDDILIFRAEKTSSLPKDILGSNDVPEAAVEEANVFFLYRLR